MSIGLLHGPEPGHALLLFLGGWGEVFSTLCISWYPGTFIVAQSCDLQLWGVCVWGGGGEGGGREVGEGEGGGGREVRGEVEGGGGR